MTEAKLPPGFRFHPRDEELVCDYLAKKITVETSTDSFHSCMMMIDVDLNKCEPWDLPEEACLGGKEWYFFSLRDRKYATGYRTNRATQSGYWKATGKDREVTRKGKLVGMKKTLVFYQGRAPKGRKTDWVMHEFRMEGEVSQPMTKFSTNTKEDWVLCRVFCKSRGMAKKSGSVEPCFEETSSWTLPTLVDTFINFDQPPLRLLEGCDQVPYHAAPNSTTTATNPTMSHDFGSCFNTSMSCDKKVIKAVLDHLTEGTLGSYFSDNNALSSMWNSF
ncbi:hypothetical protein J5N97_009012 [Dioscorea zingiberensis]|uniref:NAC domain-containing protein n=1 Tax=Dioscorea zingiberensis TaxID=325984 RepID=A0A9D5CXZ2_9LILI|nr:hypothetical protein J5N97_009012 [Dioscorea zingiberensis]